MSRELLVALLLAGLPAAQAAEPGVDACTEQADDAVRLRCYDALFRKPAAEPAVAPTPATADSQLQPPEDDASPLTRFWDLDRTHQSELFVVRTYLPNYLLPLHYTDNINRRPYSPTRGTAREHPEYEPLEAKFQISLRAKVAQDLLLPGAGLWLAYTQRSLWQVWNSGDSSPFRSTDYQPEAMYVAPITGGLSELPGGWRWRMLQLGVAHQSNGQGEPLSRSWNRTIFGTAVERGDVAAVLRYHRRWDEDGDDDDNPDLVSYIGNTELLLTWAPGRAIAGLTLRNSLSKWQHGSLQFDWTYPVFPDRPEGLRWYVQLFSGYGETLLDYNHKQTSLGVGLSLFSF